MFTAKVPGLGLVEWTAAQVDDYARELQRTHRAERYTIAWHRLGPFQWPTLTETACKRCGEPWPCPAAWWADGHQDNHARDMASAAFR
ncbi:MAG TPA: hypothetical protein VIQ30_02300 [Pseudonocardia sp.]